MDGQFCVIVVSGNAADLCDLSTESLRFDALSWEESVELARLSFLQGYEIIVWKQDDEGDGGGGSE